jgi:hypothetical protein
MNTEELRDLLDARTESAGTRPLPPTFQRRLRRARRTRRAAVAGASALVVAGAALLVPGGKGSESLVGASPTATGTSAPTASIDDQDKKYEAAQLAARYWWNRLPGPITTIAWPKEKRATLTFTPTGTSVALGAACDGFESNVNVKMTLSKGATWAPEYGGKRSNGFNCFEGGLFDMRVKPGTATVTLTLVAASYPAEAAPDWPVSRPRTWTFAFYQRDEKAAADEKQPSWKTLPERLLYVDQAEAMAILNNRHTP